MHNPLYTKEVMAQSLFPRFAATIQDLTDSEVSDPRTTAKLALAIADAGGRKVSMMYAPFDHINPKARIVIVGLTPGLQQARNALSAGRAALRRGASENQAAAEAKVFASFSGPMRANLVAMLDRIGVARRLGIESTALLWNERSDLVHFTSALRYPVFVDGGNWSGQPDALRVPQMQEWLLTYLGEELRSLRGALVVPLGPKVSSMLHFLVNQGVFDGSFILDGLPHPSGANAERIAYFLGKKHRDHLSTKTDPMRLDAARAALEAKLKAG